MEYAGLRNAATKVVAAGGFAARQDARVIRSTSRRTANKYAIALTAAERAQLERWARASTSTQRLVRRSRIVLLAAEGVSVRESARLVDVSARTVMLWRKRFLQEGAAGLRIDRAGRGRKPSIAPEVVASVIGDRDCARSGRATARAHGISPSSVRRLWRRQAAPASRGTAKR